MTGCTAGSSSRGPRPRGAPSVVLAACSIAIVALASTGISALNPDRAPVHGSAVPVPADEESVAGGLDSLRTWESARRAATDFARVPPGSRAAGADPFALAAIPGTDRFAGTLRGADALVVLDAELREVARLPAPPSPTAIAAASGAVFVSGELTPRVARYAVRADGSLAAPTEMEVPGLVAVRALAAGDGMLYLGDFVTGRIVAARVVVGGDPPARIERIAEIPAPEGVFSLRCEAEHLLALGLFDHAASVIPLDGEGLPVPEAAVRVERDGPIWSGALHADEAGLLLAVGAVEDRPLDRSGGFFGNIDSFVIVYRVHGARAAPRTIETLAEWNVSAAGAITPKWIAFDPERSRTLHVSGYGGTVLLEADWSEGWDAPPVLRTTEVPAGMVGGTRARDGGWCFADPLLDAWVAVRGDSTRAIPVRDDAPPDPRSRLGEALFYTRLMAPSATSDGAKSRFTCETCHFEGSVDGRVHYTGRGAVHAATKPLLGLFNNKPHFSRALDRDLTQMVHNEFRVAGAETGSSPWFALDLTREPWLEPRSGLGDTVAPEELRGALMRHLMDTSHAPNPRAFARTAWSERERTGAELFRARCEGCHAARLVADEPSSRVRFEDWERLVLSPEGPIVWGSERRALTGIVPPVHEDGPRVPSLRRLYLKRPYFTDGSAGSLGDVVAGARFGPTLFLHRADDESLAPGRFTREEAEAILAFLALL